MSSCLSCGELESKICELAEELTSGEACGGITSQGGVTIDTREQIVQKQRVLETYRQMWTDKKCGEQNDAGLYEFVQTACVSPASCTGRSCRGSRTSARSTRRYRR